MTDATTLVVAADENGSGYAEQTAWRAGGIDPTGVAREGARPPSRPALTTLTIMRRTTRMNT